MAIFNFITDIIKVKKHENPVIFIAAEVNDKALFAACAGKKAVSDFGIHCGELVKTAATIAGGNGGGSPFRAQAGGKDTSAIKKAVDAITSIVSEKAGG